MRTDGQPAMTKIIVAFRNFSNEPKNSTFSPQSVFIFFLYGSQNKQRSFQYTTLTYWLFILESGYVYCAVRAESLHIIQVNCSR